MTDEEAAKLEQQLVDARRQVLDLQLQIKRMNTEEVRLVKRLCDALGQWTGPWEDAVVARLHAARKP